MKNTLLNIVLKKILVVALSIITSVFVVFMCCSCVSKTSENKDVLNICEASEPQTIDPGLNSTVDGATYILHLFEGLAKWEKKDGKEPWVVPGLCEELVQPVENPDKTFTYTYKLRHDCKWSDGVALTAHDFVFGWNRSASVELASDFSYMFENIKGYDDIWADEPVEGAKLDIQAVDDYTFKVNVVKVVPYWDELMSFAVFMPLREDIVDNEGMWATNPETFVSNGTYKLKDWVHNSVLSLEKSDYYYEKHRVNINYLNFYLSDNSNNQLANFLDGDWDYIKSFPAEETKWLKEDYGQCFHCEPNTGTYYASWSTKSDLSPVNGNHLSEREQAEVRNAINLLIDRNFICENVAQGGNLPASSFVPYGITESNDTQFYEKAGMAGNPYYGYYKTSKESAKENYDKAIKVLKKYYNFNNEGFITNFPTLTYSYNTLDAHKAIAEYIQSVLSGVGITLNLENQEWSTFLITRKQGNSSLSRCSWISDYNDATSFLSLYKSTSANNDAFLGKGQHAEVKAYDIDLSDVPGYENIKVKNGTWAETYDVILSAISTEPDLTVRDILCHKAEDLLMSTGAICSLYYYTDTFLLQDNIKGFFTTPNAYHLYMYAYKE